MNPNSISVELARPYFLGAEYENNPREDLCAHGDIVRIVGGT